MFEILTKGSPTLLRRFRSLLDFHGIVNDQIHKFIKALNE